MDYLEFEIPLKEIQDQLDKFGEIEGEITDVDVKKPIKQLQTKLEKERKKIYGSLTPWQTVQLSRHPQRPYTLDYIHAICDKGSFDELHGDRLRADDKAMVGGIGKVEGQSFMFIGQQKGRNTKERQMRRFGMPNPDGYRKALRLMKLAEKFNIPIVTFIDTPGAYPGLEAEENGQGSAIATNIYEMALLKVPVISIVIGEGASGGALGIGVANKVLMMQNTWYSVISPESCSSILFRSWEHKERAAEALKLTPKDMLKLKLIDGIIEEPLGGAHTFPKETFEIVKNSLLEQFKELSVKDSDTLVFERQEKFINMGVYSG